MNDRFRLRAWNKEEKEMYYDVEGQYDNGCNGMGTMDHQCLTDLLEDERYIVEQCTGLKDKNGRLIYEGDIVRVTGDCMTIPPYLESKLAKVVWEINCFCFNFPHEDESYFSECWDYDILGNIHENADLLEAQNGDN